MLSADLSGAAPLAVPDAAETAIIGDIPVIGAHRGLLSWPGLKRCFSSGLGVQLMQANEPARAVIARCQRMIPCILLAGPDLLPDLSSAGFGTGAEFGRTVRVIVAGRPEDKGKILTLLRMGCMGFVDEDAPASVLRKAVRAVARGELWFDRLSISRAVQQLLLASNSLSLTPREREVLRMIAQGYSNRDIAAKLFITRETVRWHIRSLHSKLGTPDRLGMAVYAGYLAQDTAVAAGPGRSRPLLCVPQAVGAD